MSDVNARFYTYSASHPMAGQVVRGFVEVDGEGEPVDGEVILAVQGSLAEREAKCLAILADPNQSNWLRTSAGNILNELGVFNWSM